jgi:hypothetical protein
VPATTLSLALALLAATGTPRLVQNERMEFAIDYKGIRLGKAQLYVGPTDGSVVSAFLQSGTTGVASVITMRQQLASHIDRDTGLPRSTSLDAVEGNYRHSTYAAFDRVANKATVRKSGKTSRTWVVDVPPDTVDFVAMVFRLRSLPLEPDSRHAFDVLAGRVISRIVVEVAGRERVSTGIGEIDAVKVRVPTNFKGEFEEKRPTFVWFSDDPRRMIVRISAEFAIGRATATLVSYDPGAAGAARNAGPEPR